MIKSSTATILVLFLAFSFVGCDEQSNESADVVTEKSTFDLVRDDVPRWMEFAAAEKLESASLRDELGRPLSDLQSLGLRHVSVMRALYTTRAHRPMWVDLTARGLNDNGEQLFDAVQNASRTHGLDPQDVHEDTIAKLAETAGSDKPTAFADVRFEAAELKLVGDWAEEHPDATPEELARAMARRDGPTPRIAAMIEAHAGELASESRDRVRLDLFLSDALVEYGMQMRWANDAWTRDTDWPDHLAEPASDTRVGWDDLRRERRDTVARTELAALFGKPELVAGTLAEFVPPFEQYDRLAKVFGEYAQIVEAGGWPKLPDGTGELKVGDEGDAVVKLKERLAAEGYWEGDRSKRFTQSLADALKAYQQTHQLWEKGTLSRETRASLNVPAERRLAQIRVALQRWRESNIGDDSHYVFVNIPDMHVEAWKNGERQLRIKTVVGATTHERNEAGAYEYVHATPSVSSTIQHVVLNPYWWVPADIVQKEIEPEIAKNPWYLSENGYEWAEDDRGQAALRQVPGENNALGRVKINFPNDYAIYMHDTPEKSLFRWPARAFSHGCIRLERPMELARYLLEESGQWDPDAIQEIQDGGEEKWITLSNELPIHVEYYVVRVDDRGRANFLSDLYRRNQRRIQASLALGKPTDSATAPVNIAD